MVWLVGGRPFITIYAHVEKRMEIEGWEASQRYDERRLGGEEGGGARKSSP